MVRPLHYLNSHGLLKYETSQSLTRLNGANDIFLPEITTSIND